MTPNEIKYSSIEKLCLARVFSIQKLKHYFQAHVVRLISRVNPIKVVMSKPVLSDRLARCKTCQFHANFIHQPPEVLHPTVTSWPFDTWGLDVVGPLPKYSGGHLYILAATDYFSKWVEVVSPKEVKKKNVDNFIRVNIIYRFGIPRYILTDNVLPLERQIPSLWLAKQEDLTDKENSRLRLEELEALDEKSLEAQQSLECYQARLSQSFNKRVRLRSFQVGDQVLVVKRPIITSRRSEGKCSAKWDGP
ncbi:uncharacterized protein LOC142175385 [Nicotiana tabacum]|uniref:Uncharacterized protein LOC142175385 n=1 Tax=Nicotiana tabacum TaxID=4097 RepID=A0AC58TLG8_TOBAC